MNPTLRARLALVFTLILAVDVTLGEDSGHIPLRPAPQTTVFNGPVRPDGTVDFLAALNQKQLSAVPVVDNAFVDFAAVVPADRWPHERYPQQTWELLGVEPPADVPPLVMWETLAEQAGLSMEDAEALRDQALEGPWARADLPLVAKWLEVNAGAMEVLERGAAERFYAAPLIADGDAPMICETWAPQLSVLREAARLFHARANLALKRGDADAAWRDVTVIFRWSRLVSEEPFLISRLVGISLVSMARVAFQDMVEQPLTPHQTRRFIKEFRDLPPLPPLLDAVDCGDRLSTLDLLQRLHAGDANALGVWLSLARDLDHTLDLSTFSAFVHHPSFDPNAGMRLVNEVYDDFLQLFRVRTYAELTAASKTWNERTFWTREIGNQIPRMDLNNPLTVDERTILISRFLLGLTLPDGEQAVRIEMQSMMYERLMPVTLAVAGYQAEHGRLPTRLDDLIPAWLDAVPMDFFADRSVRYAHTPDGALVYSVGKDGVDDGGNVSSQDGGSADVGFCVPIQLE